MSAPRPAHEPSLLEQLDGAHAALRGAGARALAGYGAATWPFLGILAWWWSDITAGGEVEPARAAAWALALLAAFVAMRTGQAWFMAALWQHCLGEEPRTWKARDWARTAWLVAATQPATLLTLPVAFVLTLPAPWAIAHAHATVLLAGLREDTLPGLQRRAVRLALPWFSSLSAGKLLLLVLALVLVVNFIVLGALVVRFADAFFGVELVAGVSFGALLNTTTWLLAALATYAVLDPLLRAWMVRRAFLLEARTSGADLLVDLRGAASRRASSALSLAVAVGASWAALVLAPRCEARQDDGPPPAATVTPAEIDERVQDVLSGREYRWRRALAGEAGPGEESAWAAELRAWRDWILRQWRNFLRWLEPERERASKPREHGEFDLGSSLLYVLVAVLALVAAWLIVLAIRARRAAPVQTVATAAPAAATAADLQKDDVSAADKPSDVWERLARELAAAGDWRLALRAWHLAAIARLGERGFLAVRRVKSDRDYERELERRGERAVHARFAAQRRAFECRWYGRTPADEATVRTFAEPWPLP